MLTTPRYRFLKDAASLFDWARDLVSALNKRDTEIEYRLAPVGSRLLWYDTIDPPSGWVRGDGASYTVQSYPELFSVIGYVAGGSGDNFNVPDDLTDNGLYTIIKV